MELDFINEGHNAEMIAANFADRDDVIIPKIYWEYTSRRVLVMEYIDGIKITDITALDATASTRRPSPSSSPTSTASSYTSTGCSTPTRTPATSSCAPRRARRGTRN